MADEGKESVFLSKSESDLTNSRNSLNVKPFRSAYGFYKYEINSEPATKEEKKHPLSADSKSSQKDFSLTSLATSLDTEDETLLARFLNRKISKSSLGVKSGHISAIDLTLGDTEPALYLCYYCLIRQGASPASSTNITADDLATLGLDSIDLPTVQDPPADKRDQYIVCLIAPSESQLDLFKGDLDKFAADLLSKFDFESSDVVAVAKPLLEIWFESTTEFLSNCVRRIGNDIKYLIHAALTDSIIDISGTDSSFTNDIKRFVEVCSLSELLNSSGEREMTSSSEGSEANLLVNFSDTASTSSIHQRAKATVKIKVEDYKVTFENHECSKFCDDWSQALENCDLDNVSLLRQVIESYKLKAIQDMNTLKRLLKQAETDHYSLYRCYMFLKDCGNGSILLQHAEQELTHSKQPETSHVLDVLQDYMTQSGALAR